MKMYLKKMIPMLILSVAVTFMIFIYEPITVYSTNTDDFWFNFNTLLSCNTIFLLISVLIILIISTAIYGLSRITKKDLIYNIYVMLFNIGFIATYIQGNYLASKLPTIDGSPILWNNYKVEGIISIVLWIAVILINIFLIKKMKSKYMKIVSYIAGAIFLMLSVSLISTLLTNDKIYIKKGTAMPTYTNINNLSTNKNFVILLADMEDSKAFAKVLKDNNKEEIFKDFTYFPDTLAAYPFTREEIPYILSGKWYKAETDFGTYYNNALNESQLFENLRNRDYDINVYEEEFYWTDSKALELDNVKIVNTQINKISFFKQEAKYIMFKYLPYQLKKYSKIDTLNYNNCKDENKENEKVFRFITMDSYNALDKISLQSKNYFQFIHFEGGHYPFDLNKNMESIENGEYDDKIGASITYMEKYLNRIKESGQYDNTAIIILSDHGYDGYIYDNNAEGRQNPILYVKGFNESHDQMQISDKRISFEDLNESIYPELLDGKKSQELLSNVSNNRIRKYMWYLNYDDMEEQELDGHAWETEKLINTGNRYKR